MEITRSTKKAAKRSEKLAKIAKGEKTGGQKDKAIKAIGKKFYKNVSCSVAATAAVLCCQWQHTGFGLGPLGLAPRLLGRSYCRAVGLLHGSAGLRLKLTSPRSPFHNTHADAGGVGLRRRRLRPVRPLDHRAEADQDRLNGVAPGKLAGDRPCVWRYCRRMMMGFVLSLPSRLLRRVAAVGVCVSAGAGVRGLWRLLGALCRRGRTARGLFGPMGGWCRAAG